MRYLHDELIPYFHTDENLVGILTSPTLMFRLPNFNLDINCMQIKFVIPGMSPPPQFTKSVICESTKMYSPKKSRTME